MTSLLVLQFGRDTISLRSFLFPQRRGFGPLVNPPIGEALAFDALKDFVRALFAVTPSLARLL
jgi:hypothetical protein